MKTKEYVEKYELNQNDKFNHNDFVSDLSKEFIALLEVGKNKQGEINVKGFENAVRCIRMKWDAVNNKTAGQLPDKLWGYFYATVIIEMKKELFPEHMERRRQEREERKKWKEERKRNSQGGFGFNMFDFWIMLALQNMNSAPVSSFQKLGLTENASEEDVKKAYRQLSLKHHPDKGGKQSDFVEITEAKNECLAWTNKKESI